MLYLVNKSPFASTSLRSCIQVAKPGSSILLYEDGVLAAKTEAKVSSLVVEAAQKLEIYVLREDLEARGIIHVLPNLHIVDYGGFVDLVERDKVVPWL